MTSVRPPDAVCAPANRAAVIREVVVLGGGSAGLIAALTLQRRLPHLKVRVIRSPDIGIIGVGEGTTQLFPRFFFDYLRLKPAQFYAELSPTWKLGIRFEWGRRKHFHYTFSRMIDHRWEGLPMNHGFYAWEEFAEMDVWSALMEHDKAFPRGEDSKPHFCNHQHVGFHIENHKLVRYLEARCRDFGVVISDATIAEVITQGRRIQELRTTDGETIRGDLFLDASGFRSELLVKALGVSQQSYDRTLFCDRAVIGGWDRTTEPIKSYTRAETMDSGWCWQIEHEHWINRGYVYSSHFISDEDALAEFLQKNPQVSNQPRVVKFRSGRTEEMWVENVVGIGNASGFVEPLEASALQVIIIQVRTLVDTLLDSGQQPSPSNIAMYNRFIAQHWDDVRDYLAVHYRFNDRLDTPFWRACRAEVDLGGAAELVEYYRENGPSVLARTLLLNPNNPYGMEGYLAMLVGQRVPHARSYVPSPPERKLWQQHRAEFLLGAKRGFDVKQTLTAIRQPGWSWS